MGGGGGFLDSVVNTVTSPLATVLNPGIAGPLGLVTGKGPIGQLAWGGGQQVDNNMGMPQMMRPDIPAFTSQLGPDGKIKQEYQTQDVYNTGAIDKLRENALRDPGTQSKWAQMAGANAGNSIARQQAGQLSTATSNLAMQGGLRSGARERLQNQSQQQGLLTKQNAYNQIAQQDEQNRLNGLNGLAGQEMGLANYRTGIQDTNIGRATQDIGQNRLYDMNKYNEQMRAYAAQQTANAIPVTKDKGFLGNILGGLF